MCLICVFARSLFVSSFFHIFVTYLVMFSVPYVYRPASTDYRIWYSAYWRITHNLCHLIVIFFPYYSFFFFLPCRHSTFLLEMFKFNFYVTMKLSSRVNNSFSMDFKRAKNEEHKILKRKREKRTMQLMPTLWCCPKMQQTTKPCCSGFLTISIVEDDVS